MVNDTIYLRYLRNTRPNWLTRFMIAVGLLSFLAGCATTGEQQSIMDKATREHPATQAFLDFAAAAEQTDDYVQMLDDHYTAATKERILKTKGWYWLAYSSVFQFVKEGECLSIKTTIVHSRKAKIDCMGNMIARSIYIGDNLEPAHLHVNLVQEGGRWFLDRAGYIHLQTNVSPIGFKRGGLIFESPLEEPEKFLAENPS